MKEQLTKEKMKDKLLETAELDLKEIKECIKCMPEQTFDRTIMCQSFDYHHYKSQLKRYINKRKKKL